VRFADAMDTVFESDDYVLLEVGPGQTLTTLARQQASGKIIPVFPSLTFPKEEQENEYSTLLSALGELWIRGINPDWNSFYEEQQRQKIDLPGYVFDRKPCWIEPLGTIETTVVQKSVISNATVVSEAPVVSLNTDNSNTKTNDSRKDSILIKISEIIKNASGITYESDAASNTFLELGLDSLSLTQLSGRLKKEFDLPITFRQLNEGFSTPSLLADYIELNLPEDNSVAFNEEKEIVSNQTVSNPATTEIQLSSDQNQISLEQIVQQIQLLSQKIDQLQNYKLNGNSSAVNTKTEDLDSIRFNVENEIEKNGFSKTEKSIPKINGHPIFEAPVPEKKYTIMANEPPVSGSKLGRDENGNPAWFVENSNQEGEFVKVQLLESDGYNE